MSLSRDLLEQARHLAQKEPKKPKQASLRRAISTAYYALFHLLIDDACALLVSGSGSGRRSLRLTLRRAFGHGEMKKVSVAFRAGSPTPEWRAVLTAPVPMDVRVVAAAFVDLQVARHEADYDLRQRYTRREALELVRRTEEAFDAWDRCRKSHAADTYLVALLVQRQLRA